MAADHAVPPEIEEKMRAWRHWRSVWNWAHYVLGFSAAALSALIAAHTKSPFLSPSTAVYLAALAAGLTFLVTTLGAGAKAAAFETAARELEKAIALHRAGSLEGNLFNAEARGIDILNRLK